jgi:hypothetical protein
VEPVPRECEEASGETAADEDDEGCDVGPHSWKFVRVRSEIMLTVDLRGGVPKALDGD